MIQVRDIIEGRVEPEEMDRQEIQQAKITQAKVEIKKRETEEKVLQGRKGKGHQPGYKSFCRHCFTEYLVDMPKCYHCKHDTMTFEERMSELRDKLEEYKTKQQKKKEKKNKWENWQKTQALLKNKSTTNYKKWDVWDSGSEEENTEDQEPILPKNDPQFQAMEQDMLERRKRRQKDKKEAEALKEQGNMCLRKGLYKSAQKYYTEALEHKKDLLCLYTNRALARVKIEEWQGAIDDATRLLEYCECFHDGYTKEKDLCYKALMRRQQAFRGLKKYQEALLDLTEAEKLIPDCKDVARFKKVTLEDIEFEKGIEKIMGNAELLKGKEYLDFILDFLQGKKDNSQQPLHKDKIFCFHQLTQDNTQKLESTLQNKDMILYFNVRDGFKTLVGSLEFNANALPLIQNILDKDTKMQEEFQRQKLYEKLIDFLNKSQANTESKTLDNNIVHLVLEILETASMNEFVRENLAEKKKIKDLFLVVIRSIKIEDNRKLVSSLIQFVSNLCYGSGKFRTMLKAENPQEFFKTLGQILKSTQPQDKDDKTVAGERVLLKQALLGFIGNLCVDQQLRLLVAKNTEQILDLVYQDFERDLVTKPFMWLENVSKHLGIFINISVETAGQEYLIEKSMVKQIEGLIMHLQYKGEEQEVINRCFNQLSKIARDSKGAMQIAESKNIIMKVQLFFNASSYPQTVWNALRIFHACCKIADFRSICLESHKFTIQTFSHYVTEVKDLFGKAITSGNQEELVNCCSSISAFVDCFPERACDFDSLVVPLISIVKDKTDLVRKNAAVCLAKLAKDDTCGKTMRDNHGTEILVSLSSVLAKQ